MTCNLCGTREATIHLTEIVNEQMVEIHICENCAQEKGTEFKTHFSVSDLINSISEGAKAAKTPEKRPVGKCPECGMSYEEFGKTGRLGCPFCYEAFSKYLIPLIKRVQNNAFHIGKRPAHAGQAPVVRKGDLRLLQERLRKCVQGEAFEEAAKLRDEIKTLEDKMKKEKKKKSE